MRLCRLAAAAVGIGLLLAGSTPTRAAAATYCGAREWPHFAFGFAGLQAQLGVVMGGPTECEHADAISGDTLQSTTTGLAFYRKSTNTPTFTDGFNHWALTAAGLVAWSGESIDPPERASIAGPLATSRGYVYPTITPPESVPGLVCQRSNPSCGRDQWWRERNELDQDEPPASQLAQFAFLPPGLVAEQRFVEVIWLLWHWPEGQTLLSSAADNGLTIRTLMATQLVDAFAAYSPQSRAVVVNGDFAGASTWMVADVLAHELKHAADTNVGTDFATCIAREKAAYDVEVRFLNWMAELYRGLPSPEQVRPSFFNRDLRLYMNLYEIGTSSDIAAVVNRDYRGHCARASG
jgi:hypothetical protein